MKGTKSHYMLTDRWFPCNIYIMCQKLHYRFICTVSDITLWEQKFANFLEKCAKF